MLIGPDNKMVANDIWPLNSVADLEAALPSGANPQEQACTFAGTEEASIELLSVYPNPTQANLTLSFSSKASSFNSSRSTIDLDECSYEFINSSYNFFSLITF